LLKELTVVTGRRAETMAENREKLVRAARQAFAARGYAAASMDELTASAGLTRGALYHNFGDKKGLLWAVVAGDSRGSSEHLAGSAGRECCLYNDGA